MQGVQWSISAIEQSDIIYANKAKTLYRKTHFSQRWIITVIILLLWKKCSLLIVSNISTVTIRTIQKCTLISFHLHTIEVWTIPIATKKHSNEASEHRWYGKNDQKESTKYITKKVNSIRVCYCVGEESRLTDRVHNSHTTPFKREEVEKGNWEKLNSTQHGNGPSASIVRVFSMETGHEPVLYVCLWIQRYAR